MERRYDKDLIAKSLHHHLAGRCLSMLLRLTFEVQRVVRVSWSLDCMLNGGFEAAVKTP